MAQRIDQIGYNNRDEIIKEIQLRLADGMVDVELDREHYDIAINKSIQKYRQLSSGSVEEAVIFIQTQDGITKYVLPDEVIDVKRLYRRGIGTNSGGGTNFDPAFDWIKENSRKKYDGCIYLTDGFAPSPTIEPPCRVLWAISPTGKGGEHLKFGRQLIIKSN